MNTNKQKWTEADRIGHGQTKTDKNKQKFDKTDTNRHKRTETDTNGQKWTDVRCQVSEVRSWHAS